MDYYADDPALLPQGDVMGRIQWIHQNNGRIRMIGRVLSTRDLFFHFNDVELKDGQSLEQITAGDLTLRRTGKTDAASRVLRNQAELMIAPYLKDRFSFRGV